MPERNQKVQERIRDELQKNPGASTKDLQAIGREVDASVGELSLRQFNAGYVLPLKRGGRKAGKAGKAGKRAKAPTPAARTAKGRKPAAAEPARAPGRGSQKAAAAPMGDRERVRATLLEFARDFSEAETKPSIVAVLSDLDRYVDRIVGSRR